MHPLMPPDWRGTLVRGTVLLLLIAGVARVAYELLLPLVPVLIAIICMVGIYAFIVGRFGR
jgi:hypothetical protein